jgi:hypothetical protein
LRAAPPSTVPLRRTDHRDGPYGTDEGITIRETRLTTLDGELVVIPHRDVYRNVIDVHTHDAAHRIDFVVGIEYENEAVVTPAGSDRSDRSDRST